MADRRLSRRSFLRATAWSGTAFVVVGSRLVQTSLKRAASASVPSRLSTAALRTDGVSLGHKSLPELEARLSAETRNGVQAFKSLSRPGATSDQYRCGGRAIIATGARPD